MNSRTVDSFDGVQIAYDVSGSITIPQSMTLVFVHGWTCNRTHWSEQVAAFSNHYNVITIDLAGHGDSALGRSEYSMSAFARDVESVFDQERIERAVLVGHSMGGMVVIHAARLLGDRVVGLIGADTFKFLKDDPKSGKQYEQWQTLVNDYDSAMSSVVSNMFASDSPQKLRIRIAEGMIAVVPEVALGAMKGMADDAALFDLAAGLDIPKFTFNASERPMDELACREAGIELRFLPTTGHFVMNEDPIGFNRLLDEALEQIARGWQ